MRILIASLIVILVAPASFARARYAGKKEMIEKAECIVVVTITSIEETQTMGRVWTYGQKVTAKVEKCLKGDAEGTIEIYGMENFICARCEFKKGRFILFLRKDEGLWVGSNWNIGIRQIVDDKVEWFKDDETLLDMQPTPLKDVIDDIKAVLKRLEADNGDVEEKAEGSEK